VFPPGYAFARTSLAQRLTSHGVTFTSVVEEEEDKNEEEKKDKEKNEEEKKA